MWPPRSVQRFSRQSLEFDKELLDWIEVGPIGRREELLGTCRSDDAAHGRTLMPAEIA